MKTTQWDRVVTSAPLNATAAVVRDGRGEACGDDPSTAKMRADGSLSHLPLPVKAVHPNAPNADLVGARIGRYVVLGLADRPKTSGKAAVWVIRCACGNYEHRRAAPIRRQMEGTDETDNRDCCTECAGRRRRERIQKKMKQGRGGPLSFVRVK